MLSLLAESRHGPVRVGVIAEHRWQLRATLVQLREDPACVARPGLVLAHG